MPRRAPSVLRPRAVLVVALAAALLGAPSCGSDAPPAEDPAQAAAAYQWPAEPGARVELEVAGRGVIVLALYPQLAPKTVANFVKLAREGFYTGTTFHRVIPDFMIQGGDPNTKDNDPKNDGEGDPGYLIEDEFNDAPHVRGAVSMANTGRKNSGGCQFFIVQQDALHLDGHHAVFGRVIEGMDVVDAIAQTKTDKHGRWGPRNRPIDNQTLVRVTVLDDAGVGAIAADDAEAEPGANGGAGAGADAG